MARVCSSALLALAALATPAHCSLRITSEAGSDVAPTRASDAHTPSLSHGSASSALSGSPPLGVTYTVLQYSTPVTGSLSTQGGVPYFNQWNYYSYTYPGGGNGFLVYVAMISGDVDMYAADSSIPVPTRTANNFSSVSTYSEVVQVPASTCPVGPCTYYIGITLHANVNSSYSIYAVNASATVTLTDGVPYIGGVFANAYNYYTAPLTCTSSISSLSVTLSTNFGLAYTYITVNDPTKAQPSRTYFDYVLYGSGSISLSCSDSWVVSRCQLNQPCPLALAVLGVVRAAYYITASSDSTTKTLYNGIPTSAYLGAGQYEYFALNLTTYSNLTVALTALSGDPDLFISFTNPSPAAGNCAWYAIGQGDEVVSITTADAGYANVTMPATLYIAVYAWGTANASFTLTASVVGGNSSSQLIDGLPQAGVAPPHRFSYFTFNMTTDPAAVNSLDIAATPSSGSVDLYVSNSTYVDVNGNVAFVYPSPYCAAYDPSGTGLCIDWEVLPWTYTWSSVRSATQDFISIPASAIPAGAGYVVGVFATTPDGPGGTPQPAYFDVVATTSDTSLQLQAGVAVPGAVYASGQKFYSFTFYTAADIVIVGTTSTGSMDLFASESVTQPGPGANTYNTSNSKGYVSDDVLYIPFTSLSPACRANVSFYLRGCTLYIGSLGWFNMPPSTQCVYQLTANVAGSPAYPVRLNNGMLTDGVVPAYGYGFYYAYVNIPNTQSIYVSVSNTAGSTALAINIGAGRFYPYANGNNTADFYQPDVGGYERMVLTPAYTMHSGAALDALEPTAAVEIAAQFGSSSSADAAWQDGAPMPGGGYVLYPATSDTAARSSDAAARAARMSAVVANLMDGDTIVRTVDLNQDGEFLHRYARELGVHDALAALYAEDVDAASPSPLGRPRYCNNCPMYATVVGMLPVNEFQIQYAAGATYTTLQDARGMRGITAPGGTLFYAFDVTNPNVDVRLNIQQWTGTVNAYIATQSALSPYRLPSRFSYTYSMQPWSGQNTLTISHTDPNFCVSSDGSVTAPPCTLIIAVMARNNQTANFVIVASADGNFILTQLQEAQGTSSSVLEGQYTYFLYQSSAPGIPAPPSVFYAQADSGRVNMYITNAYIPGSSPPSMLPFAGNTAVCMWTATSFPFVSVTPADPCYVATSSVYTIGVQGASGIAGLTSDFNIVAQNAGDDLVLSFGEPLTLQVTQYKVNRTYLFDLVDATQDIIISATPSYGDVSMLVRHVSNDGVIPGCWKSAAGAQLLCTGYTWLATGIQGAASLYLRALTPCAPVLASGIPSNAIITNTSECANGYRPGRYYVSVYGYANLTEYSVSVIRAGDALRLPDGQPQLAITSGQAMCTSRDNVTGVCTPGGWPVAQAAVFTFTVPASDPQLDQYVIIERLCAGMSTGNCGNNLHAFYRTCLASKCTPMDALPYTGLPYDGDVFITDALGSISIPFDSCFPNGTPPPFSTDACNYYVAVYPVCSSPLAPPGVGCANAIVRATYSGGTGLERIPADCFTAGSTCTLPPESTSSNANAVRRYEAYAGDAPTTITTTISACVGDVDLYLCLWGAASACNPVTLPGPGNSDQAASSAGSNNGAAVLNGPIAGLFFLGVVNHPGDGIGDATFQVILTAGRGVTLSIPSGFTLPIVSRDPVSNTWAIVEWNQAVLSAPGQSAYIPNGLTFSLYAFLSPLTLPFHLETACGVFAAAHAVMPPAGLNAYTAGTSFNLTGMNPNAAYYIALVATCAAGACMPGSSATQQVAYLPQRIAPAPYNPSPTPSAAPTAGPASGPGASSNVGAIAGGVIGALLGVALIGGAAYYVVTHGGVAGVTAMMTGGSAASGSSGVAYTGLDAAFSGSSSLNDGGGVYVPPGAAPDAEYAAM